MSKGDLVGPELGTSSGKTATPARPPALGRASNGSQRVQTRPAAAPSPSFAAPDALVLQAVARASIAWDSMETGAERLLSQLVAALGLPASALWLRGKDGLEPRASWVAESVDEAAFERALLSPKIRLGADLADLATARAEPLFTWETSGATVNDPLDPYSLRGLIAVPARVEDDTLGVVVFYGTERSEFQRPSLEALVAAAHLLGDLVARWQFQETHAKLTRRELELLTLASRGLTSSKIAAQLSLSPWTVKTHFEHIRLKLQVSDRTAAVAHALRTGMIV